MVRNDGEGIIAGLLKIHLLVLNNTGDKSPTCPGEPTVFMRMRMQENKGEL